MGFSVELKNLVYSASQNQNILQNVTSTFAPGEFVAVLGENGAGKTSLLDLMMGFRSTTAGSILIQNENPYQDHWQLRQKIAYLSEKVDMPGDWTIDEFLKFNRYFYTDYSLEHEERFCQQFRINRSARVGNLSAGEIRRAQIVGALSIRPRLIIVDEITAVLDITGRRQFMNALTDLNKELNSTVILATNILENLETFISHIFLLKGGSLKLHQTLKDFTSSTNAATFSDKISNILENP